MAATRVSDDSLSKSNQSLDGTDSVWHYDLSGQRNHHSQKQDGQKTAKQPSQLKEDEPLVDTTAAIPLRSKRTERMQKKSKKKATHSEIKSFLDLPPELLLEVLSFLRPSDLFALIRVDKSTREYISNNEHIIAEAIIISRYLTLTKCLPLPILFSDVDATAHSALLSPRHQQRLIIHKAPYQHIKSADPLKTCSCMACVMAWNNLCLCVDLAHWQPSLDRREPITMIPRGSRPKWNTDLVDASALVVDKCIRSLLWYARVLETHLDTTVRTIVRQAAVRRKGGRDPRREAQTSKRLFHLSREDIATQTDEFMQRSGPPSFEFPFTRDNYYTLISYLPNRRWDEGRWIYYGDLHDRDVAWAKMIAEREAKQAQAVAFQQDQNAAAGSRV